jgi:hypothetical protein
MIAIRTTELAGVALHMTAKEARWLKRYFVHMTTGQDPYNTDVPPGVPHITELMGYNDFVAQPVLNALKDIEVNENSMF